MTALKLVAQDDAEINLRTPLTDDDLTKLRKRNEERVAAAKTELGQWWVAHPKSLWIPTGTKTVLEPYRRKLGSN